MENDNIYTSSEVVAIMKSLIEDLHRWPDLLPKFHTFFLTKSPITEDGLIVFHLGDVGCNEADGTHQERFIFARLKSVDSAPAFSIGTPILK